MTSGLSIGVFGGSFDPVHNGHLRAASAVLDALELDEVLFVPAGNQWQKKSNTLGTHRLAMLALATSDYPQFAISTVDLDRAGPTYTFDTLSDLVEGNPGAKLFFILGTDALAGLASWQRASDILDMAQFVVVSRPGTNFSVPDFAQGRVWQLEIDALDLSSTGFREAYAAGSDVVGMIPEPVLRYIGDHNLYRGTDE